MKQPVFAAKIFGEKAGVPNSARNLAGAGWPKIRIFPALRNVPRYVWDTGLGQTLRPLVQNRDNPARDSAASRRVIWSWI